MKKNRMLGAFLAITGTVASIGMTLVFNTKDSLADLTASGGTDKVEKTECTGTVHDNGGGHAVMVYG